MSIVEKIKSIVGGAEPRLYSYQCGDCGTVFESQKHNPNFTECPKCGSDRVRTSV